MQNIIKRLSPYAIATVILITLNCIYFIDQFNGKTLFQGDMHNVSGMAQEAKTFYESTGKNTFWTNSMFGGMPTYQIYSGGGNKSIIDYLLTTFSAFFNSPLSYFMTLSLASFIGLCFFNLGPWIAMIGAIAISFASNHMGLMAAGHLTKLGALSYIPFMAAGIYQIFNKSHILGAVLFTLGLTGSIKNNHIQMTYYFAMILAIYVIYEFILLIKSKEYLTLFKILGLLIIGSIISLMVNIGLLNNLNDYSKDTMRGGAVLQTQSDNNTAGGSKGLGWDYAMQWSNGFVDLISLLAPGATGGSSNEKWSPNSKMGQTLRRGGMQVGADFRLPLYWGALPFTGESNYLGIIILMLFVMGIILIKGPFMWFSLLGAILLIIQSMGKHFPVINQLFFDYLPFYNKFRTPNSILNVLASSLPIFSVYTLHHIIQKSWNKNEIVDLFKKTVFPLAGLVALLALVGPMIFDMTSPGDAQWKTNTVIYNELMDTRVSYFRTDLFRSLVFLSLAATLVYFYTQNKIKKNYFLLAIGALILIDLWTVAKRYLDSNNFEKTKPTNKEMVARPADNQILQDKDPNYRVFDLSVDPFNTATTSYFHKTVGGYHPAKLRRYQDMIDFYIGKGDQKVLNMLNTKYIIDRNGSVSRNPNAMGNAWFVSTVKSVSTPDEEIQAISTINPAEEAVILTSEFNEIKINPSYSKNGTISLASYEPNKLSYQSNSTSDQLAIFSEIWFGPNKGWNVTIDGQSVEHVRANYTFRALPIPAGNHAVVFEFNPKKINANHKKSYWIGNVLGLALLACIGFALKNWYNTPLPAVSLQSKQQPTGLKGKTKK